MLITMLTTLTLYVYLLIIFACFCCFDFTYVVFFVSVCFHSYTFQKIQDNTDLHWYFQRYTLIYEYYSRPMLPPPFVLISHVIMLVHAIIRRICNCCNTNSEATLGKSNRHNYLQLLL